MTGIAALIFGAFVLIFSTASADPTYVGVELAVDLESGVVVSTTVAAGGGSQSRRIVMPPLGQAADPLVGYIGPEGALLPSDAGWLPALPEGAAGWRVSVTTAPGALAVPFPGGSVVRLADGRGLTTFDLPRLAARAPLIVGRFEMAERKAGAVTLRTFFTSANAAHAEAYLQAAGAAIEALAARIGAYPYPAFAVVESPLPVGLGFPGYTLVSGRILPLAFMRGRSLWHEIAHVWWGNGVLVDYDRGNWAEGFATFFADYALAEREGAEAAREMRYDWLLEYDALAPGEDRPLRAFVGKSHGQAQAIGYGKAAMTLHMLRREIGASAFEAGTRRFWLENRFERAGWAEVQAAFEAAAGRPLGAFFDRWIDRPGAGAANPSDRNFDIFRSLAASERIQTLRAVLQAQLFAVAVLPGAPGNVPEMTEALATLGAFGPEGTPVYVGGIDALAQALGHTPPETGVAAIWVTTDRLGRAALALSAPDLATAGALAERARHYGRWSWLAVDADGRPRRGRWAP